MNIKLSQIKAIKAKYQKSGDRAPVDLEILSLIRYSLSPSPAMSPTSKKQQKRVIMPILRNRDPLLCPWNAVAMVLFYRYHICGMAAPNFSDLHWLQTPLFFINPDPAAQSDRKGKEQLLATVKSDLKNMHNALSLRLLSVKHTDNTSASVNIRLKEHSIHPSGSIPGSISEIFTSQGGDPYAELCETEDREYTDINYEPLACLAGLDIANRGLFPPRTEVNPPADLASQIFPWLEQEVNMWSSDARNNPSSARFQPSFFSHIGMLIEFRRIILQDAAQILGDPKLSFLHNHPMYQSKLFTSPQFLQY